MVNIYGKKPVGTGVVPKWMSWIGITSYACAAAIVVWIITWVRNSLNAFKHNGSAPNKALEIVRVPQGGISACAVLRCVN